MNEIQKKLKDMVVMFISDDTTLEESTIDEKVREVSGMPTFSGLTDEEIETVKESIKAEFSIKLDKGVLIEEKGHERWFLSRKATLEMKYWERYKKYLLADMGFSSKVVNTMDDVLDTLTDLLGDPTRNISYKRRGLIIGDVQSGKTANYTGLICKAVDSGYKVVVLLTGTIEKLRQQTQSRIDEGFVGRDSDALMKQQEDRIVIGVGKYDASISPVCLTSTTDDFKQQNARNLNFDLRHINGSVIFVVKKNSSVLKRLNKWLRTFNQNGDQPIDNSILVIDDEADNASVNTRSEDTPTAINEQIREMLKNFTKSSYVGFTATPFANIFIDPDSFNDMVAEDLFPKDYIYSLNAPSNYIGARNIFGENGSAAGMLVEIDDDLQNPDSIESILPLSHKSSVRVSSLPEDMETAIASFMLANVLEDIRGRKGTHRSMLINVSRFTAVQEQVSDLVNDYLKNMQSACKLYGNKPSDIALQDAYISKLREAYISIYPYETIEWDDIQSQLYSSCAGIIVQTINQRNGKNLSFDDYKDGLRLIAVGGMSLSRGLTLEGLVVSYFYRNSRMYDTLMQMGRWFGYRGGYEDLCRIWMSADSIEWYRYISAATDELREEIKRYEDSDLTPMEFGLRVRSDINSLIVTARNKMKSAERRECLISLSGVAIDTPELYSDLEKNAINKKAVDELVNDLVSKGYKRVDEGRRGSVKWGYKNIPLSIIVDFLEKIEVSPKNEKFNTTAIINFTRQYRGDELRKWDISFASGDSESQITVGELTYNPPKRQYSIENNGKILKMSGSKKTLQTPGDFRYGLDDSQYEFIKEQKGKSLQKDDYFRNTSRNPLLLIYYVELGNYVGKEDYQEIREQCERDLQVGFAIGIPGLSDNETKYAKYVLNKIAIQHIFEGEVDDWAEDDEEYDD